MRGSAAQQAPVFQLRKEGYSNGCCPHGWGEEDDDLNMSGFHHVLELMVLCITKAPLGRFNEEVGCQKLCGTSINLCAGLWP